MPQTTLTYLIEMRAKGAKRETEGLGKAAKGTSTALDQASGSAENLGKESKKASSSLKRLSRDLSVVGRSLGSVSSRGGKSTKVLSGIVGALGGLAVAGGPATLAIAAVAGGLVAGGIAAAVFSAGVADATANARQYSAELEGIQGLGDVFSPVPEETLQSLERSSQATGALKSTVQAISLAFANEFAPEIEAASLLVVALGLAVADFARSGIEKIRAFMQSIETMGPIAQKVFGFVTMGVADQIKEIAEGLEDGAVKTDSYIGRAQALVGSMKATKEATEGTTEAIKDQGKELDLLGIAAAEFNADHGGRDDSILGSNPQQEAQSFLSSLGVGNGAISPVDQAQLDQMRLLTDLTRGLITGDQYQAGVEAINATLETSSEITGKRRLSADQIGSGLSAAGTVASGDIMGIASMAGPVGVGIGALMSGIVSLGETGTSQIVEELESFHEDLLKGLEILPEMFSEVIPDFAEALTTTLPPALLAMLPALFKAIWDLVNPVSIVNGGLIEGLDIPVISDVAGKVSDGIDAIQDWRSSLFGDKRDRGGHIGKPGYYFLHPGEEVIRSNGQASQRARAGMSGGGAGVNIRLEPPSMFPFLYQLQRATGPGGLREAY